jgi:hypothetical protein
VSAAYIRAWFDRNSGKVQRTEGPHQILLSHAGYPLRIPASTVALYVDDILVKNKMARRIYSDRADSVCAKNIIVVGDPRVGAMYEKRDNVSGRDIVLVLTKRANDRMFYSETDGELDALYRIARVASQSNNVIIKKRNTGHMMDGIDDTMSIDSRMLWCFFISI